MHRVLIIVLIVLVALMFLYKQTMTQREAFEVSPRIIGGRVTQGKGYPWHANLSRSIQGAVAGKSICGGAVISNDTVVTAAHCFKAKPTHVWVINNKGQREVRQVKYSKVHPKYKAVGGETKLTDLGNADVAIIKTTTSFGPGVQKISLAPVKRRKYGTDVHVIGRGTGSNESLHRATVYEVPPSKCNIYSAKLKKTRAPKVLCLRSSSKSACNGDSGGPAYYSKNGKPMLVGVTSGGKGGCGKTGDYHYSVYTDLRNKENRSFVTSSRTKLFGVF